MITAPLLEKKIFNLEDLQNLARELVPIFKPRQLLLLKGPLGVGKTQLTRFILSEMGVMGVSSPTFALHQTYSYPENSPQQGLIDHLDLYRLPQKSNDQREDINDHDLESTGLWDLLSQPRGLILVEWADRVANHFWPPHWSPLEVKMDFIYDDNDNVQNSTRPTQIRNVVVTRISTPFHFKTQISS